VTLDEELVAAIRKDYRQAALEPADRAMLDYVAKLTHILQINLIASFFNYINRVADGLGVGKP
jgi:hypothetical protein